VGGAAAAISGGKFKDGFTTAAAGYLFNSSLHAAKERHSFEVDLVVELPNASAIVGHTFLAFLEDGEIDDVVGYGISDSRLISRVEAFIDAAPGGLEDNYDDFVLAKSGDSSFAILRISVTEEQYYGTMQGMYAYAEQHPNYWTYVNDCTHAALWALNYGGAWTNGIWKSTLPTPALLYNFIRGTPQ